MVGKRSYLTALIGAVLTFAKILDFIPEDLYQTLMGFVLSGGIAFLRAAKS